MVPYFGLVINSNHSILFMAIMIIGIWALLYRKSGFFKHKVVLEGLKNLSTSGPKIFATYQVRFSDQASLYALPVEGIFLLDWSFTPGTPYTVKVPNGKVRWVNPKEGIRGLIRAAKDGRSILKNGFSIAVSLERFCPNNGLEITPHRILRLIHKGTSSEIIPFNLDQPEGSDFWQQRNHIRHAPPGAKRFPWRLMIGTSISMDQVKEHFTTVLQELGLKATKLFINRLSSCHEEFAYQALRTPKKICFPDQSNPNLNLSYEKTLVAVTCLSDILREKLGPENHVAIWLPNSTGSALTNIALSNLGKISVNLNYTSTPDIIQYCLEKTGAKVVITAKRFTSKVAWPDIPGIQVLYLEELLPQVTMVKKALVLLLSKILPKELFVRTILKAQPAKAFDTVTVVFSSGSTGKPKGIMLTHANILSNAWATIRGANVSTEDTLLGALPFFHSFGYTVSMWAPLFAGASTVYQPDPRQARDIGAACKNYKCTVYLSTATFLRFCLKKSEPGDFDTLRLLICGAEKLPPSLSKEFEAKFGILPLEGYGCTELSPVTSINKPDFLAPNGKIAGNMIGSIGLPVPGVCIRISDPETGKPVGAGHEGMVSVTGLNVMKGYLGEPEKTAQAVQLGWYITGDMGHISPEGYITLTGRLSRFAKIGGEMVPLERIEEELHLALNTNEKVCGVTCVPDPTRGERIVVLYVPELIAPLEVQIGPWVKMLNGKGLPNLWIPSEKDFYPVHELATLGSGKLDLSKLKAVAMEIAGSNK